MPVTHRIVLPCLASVLFVTAANAVDVNLDPLDNLQAAINDAADDDVLILAPGEYQQLISITDKRLVIRSADPNDPAILNGVGLDTVVKLIGAGTSGTRLEDLRITGGSSTNGGGMDIDGAGVIAIHRCEIVGNTTTGNGGGIWALDSGLEIVDCTFALNDAISGGSDGGGIYATNGGPHLISGTRFFDNFAADSGSALRVDAATAQITDCDFEANVCQGTNHGTTFLRLGAVMHFDACRFVGNDAAEGSVIHVWQDAGYVEFRNCVAQGNTGTVFHNNDDALGVYSCTIQGNAGTVVVSTGQAASTFRNCVMADNDGGIASIGAGSVTYCLIPGGYGGAGNVDGVATFENTNGPDGALTTFDDNDLRLAAGSLGIDAGTTLQYTGPMQDYAGAPRGVDDPDTVDSGEVVIGPVVDMGAFEFQPTPQVDTCAADVNGDGVVDVSDMLALFGAWGVCP